jgi:hypothetical protein
MTHRYTSIWAALAAMALASSLASADSSGDAADPDWDANQSLTVEEAIDLSMQADVPLELVHLLSQMYAGTGDLDIIAALRRLEREAAEPAVRAAAATAQLTAVELPDDVAVESGINELPADVDAVLVECNGECDDNVLGDFCQSAHTDAATAVAVSCENVQENDDRQCGGSGDNRCGSVAFNDSTILSQLCDDQNGFDAIVYCANP